MKNKKLIIPSILLLLVSMFTAFIGKQSKEVVEANATNGSYWSSWISSNQSAINTGGTTLLSALQSKISENMNVVSYDGLKSAYKTSDAVPGSNGSYIWDMYGGNTYPHVTSMPSSTSKNGDGYNREHSIPKSWFKEAKPAYSDIVHVVPADGYINTIRNNYIFGEVQAAEHTFNYPAQYYNNKKYAEAGVSKRGSAKAINGVSSPKSTVFEPDDQYKGDFARIYMYFATRYGGTSCAATNSEGSSIFSSTFTNSNPYMTNYGLALVRKWHVQDPVSQKELDRNDAIETIQGNRNPFVDYPEWADKIFNSNYEATHNGGGSGDVGGEDPVPTVNNVTLSSNSLTLDLNGTKTTTLTANVSVSNGASNTVTWKSSNTGVATVNNGVVTAIKTGTATITATSTVDSTKFATCLVTVKDTTPSGGDSGETTTETGTATMATGNNASSATVNGKSAIKCGTSKASGDMTITVPAGTTKLSFYASGWKGTTVSLTVKNGNTSVSTLSLKNDDGISNNSPFTLVGNESNFYHEINLNNITKETTLTLSASSRFVVWGAQYHIEKVVEKVTLKSISLNTDNVTKTFDVGDTFTYSGLVVTASYSDLNSKTVTPTSVSTPDMSTAGSKTVTVSYTEDGVTVEATYQITVNEKVVITYSATVSKTFKVGETITKNDIVVKASTGETVTNFTFIDYKFTYEDAASGGALTNKTLSLVVAENEISFTAHVQREEHKEVSVTASVTDTLTASDFKATTTNYVDFSGVKKNSGATYAGQSAKDTSGNIQLRSKNSNSGIVSTTSGGIIESVKITVGTGANTIQVYGSNVAYNSASNLYQTGGSDIKQGTLIGSLTATGTITFAGEYQYIGIRSYSGAIYISSIEIKYKGSSEQDTAKNLANYIMFEDTTDQCLTKYDVVKGYFANLSPEEQTTFMTSSDYVISNARLRLEKWAIAHGEEITTIGATYQFASKPLGIFEVSNNDSSSIIVIFISAILVAITTTIIIKKRKKI